MFRFMLTFAMRFPGGKAHRRRTQNVGLCSKLGYHLILGLPYFQNPLTLRLYITPKKIALIIWT
jgi:hypothetical protein